VLAYDVNVTFRRNFLQKHLGTFCEVNIEHGKFMKECILYLHSEHACSQQGLKYMIFNFIENFGSLYDTICIDNGKRILGKLLF